jgi:NAD(P)-dependent dehydrogenase (short-subunit alcohol dehydrogenase family)
LPEVKPAPAESAFVMPIYTSDNQSAVYLSRETLQLFDSPLRAREGRFTDQNIWIIGHQVGHLKSLAKWMHPSNRVTTHCWSDFRLPAEMIPDSALIPDLVIDIYDPLETIDYISATADEVAGHLQACSTNRFQFYKAYGNASNQYPSRMVLLTMIDGALGRDHSGRMADPSSGALFGFYKSLQKEWSNQLAIIDLEPGVIQRDPNHCVDIIAAEVAAGMPDQEVAYLQSNRSVLKVQSSPPEKPKNQAVQLDSNHTILAAGGARGITAEIVKALAERHGCNFILLGRTKLFQNVAELSAMPSELFEKQRADILEKLKQKHHSVKPVMVEREFSRLKQSVEIYRNLQAIKRHGSKVHYYAVDVTHYAQLCNVVERARAIFGPIDVLIHGAGIDRSRPIGQKSVEEFERVFQTKALGAIHLTRACAREPLRYIIGLASISGRFGNGAQSDYSAGNSFIDFWIDYTRKIFPEAIAKSINWSGWAEVGMAWNNDFVRTYSENSGIQLISVKEGQAAFLQELSDPARCSPVIIHKGLGPLPSPSQFKLNESRFVMIDRIVQHQADRQRAHRLLSVKRDLMLDQHRLQGTPLVPAVAYMEMCAEYYAYLTGKENRIHFEDIHFDKALRLFNDKPVEVLIEPEWLEGQKVRFCVRSLFKPRKLGMVEELNHCTMVVSQSREFQEEDPRTWPVASEAGDETKSASFLEKFIRQSRARINLGNLFLETEIYLKPQQLYFKDCLNGQIYTRCLPLSQLSNSAYPIDDYLLNPCFLDTVFQAGGFYCTLKLKQMFLPWHIEKISVLRVPRNKGGYWVYAQKVSETDDSFCLNIAVCNDQYEPCYIAKGAHFHKIAS